MPSVTTPQGVDSFIDGLAAFNLSQCFCWWGNQSRLKHDASCCPIRRNRTRLNTRHAGFPESASRERHVRRAACQHQCESFRLVIHARQVHHLVEIKTTCGTHRRRPAGLRCNIRVRAAHARARLTCIAMPTTHVHVRHWSLAVTQRQHRAVGRLYLNTPSRDLMSDCVAPQHRQASG